MRRVAAAVPLASRASGSRWICPSRCSCRCSAPGGASTSRTSSQPVRPSTRVRKRSRSASVLDASPSHTSRHGPTAGAEGDHPGVRPSSVVRHQRNCCCGSIGTRHRGRDRRWAQRAASGSARMRSSLPRACRRSPTERRCARNMLSLASSGSPLRLTSQMVARPSSPRIASGPRPAGRSKPTRQVQDSASRSRARCSVDHSPRAARKAASGCGLSSVCQPRSAPQTPSSRAICQPSCNTWRGMRGDACFSRRSDRPARRGWPRCSGRTSGSAAGPGIRGRKPLPARASR